VLLGRGALEVVLVTVTLSLVVAVPTTALSFLFSEAPEGGKTLESEVRLGLWLATRALEQSVFQGLLIALVVSVATLLVWLPVLTPRRGVVGARGERLLRAVCSAIGAAVVLLQYNALSIAFGDPLSFPPLLLVPITVVAAVVWWRAGAVLRAVRRAAQDPAPEPRPSPSGG
jgi:hypothetical protein